MNVTTLVQLEPDRDAARDKALVDMAVAVRDEVQYVEDYPSMYPGKLTPAMRKAFSALRAAGGKL